MFVFLENIVGNSITENVPNNMQTQPYEHVWRLPERLPRVVTSQTRNQEATARAKNAVRISSHCLRFLNKLLEHVVWVDFHCEYSKQMFEENEKDQCQEHIVNELARPWPRPGEFTRRGSVDLNRHKQKAFRYYQVPGIS